MKKLLYLGIVLMLVSCGSDESESTLTDKRDGQTYKTVKIGNQVWMAENLNVDKFRNGELIPEAKTNEEWEKAGENGEPAWCYLNNNPDNGKKYGKLYNFFAVNDPRGLAPEGWKTPSKYDWSRLFDVLGEHLGHVTIDKGMDDYGFSGRPGSLRDIDGRFENQDKNSKIMERKEKHGYWWSSASGIIGNDRHNVSVASYIFMEYEDGWSDFENGRQEDVESGLSVRCLRPCANESEGESSTVNLEGREVATIQIGNLEVMTEDLGKMSWMEAKLACEFLCHGWRLPTMDELNLLYENREKIGGFSYQFYWSSTENGSVKAWGLYFREDIGEQFGDGVKHENAYIRVVRAF